MEEEEEEENGGEERGNCSGLAHTSSFHNWRSGCARKGLSSSGLPKPLFLQDNLSLAASCRQHLAETDFYPLSFFIDIYSYVCVSRGRERMCHKGFFGVIRVCGR